MSFLHELKSKTKMSEGIEAPPAVSVSKPRKLLWLARLFPQNVAQ
jgi:hypothetical protein